MNCLWGQIVRFVSDVAEIIMLEHNLKNGWMDELMNECEAATSYGHVALESSGFIIEKHCMKKV
jgi:hypothetical protein